MSFPLWGRGGVTLIPVLVNFRIMGKKGFALELPEELKNNNTHHGTDFPMFKDKPR
jgi:hypothetical protein